MRSAFLLLLVTMMVSWMDAGTEQEEFMIAKKAFDQGHYTIAEAYFREILRQDPGNIHAPDAAYCLVYIQAQRDDFIAYMHAVNHFLKNYEYDTRSRELLAGLLKELQNQQAYRIIYEYIKRYEYLLEDTDMLCQTAIGMYTHGDELSQELLEICPQEDTILILQASLCDDMDKKLLFFDQVTGVEGDLYTIEAMLENGDTVTAFDIYAAIQEYPESPGLLYRYARVSLMFDKDRFNTAIDRLNEYPEYKTKMELLSALSEGTIETYRIPGDEEEYRLLRDCLTARILEVEMPDSIDLDSVLPDSFGLSEIEEVCLRYPGTYVLDSLHCELLLKEGDVRNAYDVIVPYFDYVNTRHYVRMVSGMVHYSRKMYKEAATDILLSQSKQVRVLYVLGKAFGYLDRDPVPLYETVLSAHIDSSFRAQVQRKLVTYYFNGGRYKDIINMPYNIMVEDDSLIRKYLYSLAREGKFSLADSISRSIFADNDIRISEHYGQYLIAKQAFKTARVFYDSLYTTCQDPLPPDMQYTWALIPMLEGKTDTALDRFKQFIGRVPPDRPYYMGAFKCASIHYLRQEFDSAAYYYGIASADDSLQIDALQNQLICYKKAAEWKGVMYCAETLLALIDEQRTGEIHFEYGYAALRYGDFRKSIIHLKAALQIAPSVEYYYWLGELYLGKGEFLRALYMYRKIIDHYYDDEMWCPTAEYKVGIVLEFMDRFEEAKKVYLAMVEEHGKDTWGIEAQKRLDLLK